MKEFGGLQIDVRCVKCGRPPAADVTLFEMQNHLYICNVCRQDAEQKGKRIAWVNGLPQEATPAPTSPLPPRTQTMALQLPPNSLFAALALSLTTPVEEIEAAIERKMKEWLRAPNSQEKRDMLSRLHEWQEQIEDPGAFEAYRNSLKPKREGRTLSVGGRMVMSAEEFVAACESSREGWADGERYLRRGQLKQWVLYQLMDRTLANDVDRYQKWTAIPDFRALNELLYRLMTTRPFRLYKEQQWQSPRQVPGAETPEQLAMLCDTNWECAEAHLYDGSLIFWLEQCRGIQGLNAYYKTSLIGYARAGKDRGVGLELLLEHAIPTLQKPQLRVTFDGTEGHYTLDRWDRELPHKPIEVMITNTTRGFTSLTLALEQKPLLIEPAWLATSSPNPLSISGRPGANIPIKLALIPANLTQLLRGKRYQRTFSVSILGEKGETATTKTYPVTLKTMSFYQGLRGVLWRWGLRGTFPGLAWNFVAAAFLALLPLFLLPKLVPLFYTSAYTQLQASFDFTTILHGALGWCADILSFLSWKVPLAIGVLMGVVGWCVGIGKGHADYDEKRASKSFRNGVSWLSLFSVIALEVWHREALFIFATLQQGRTPLYIRAVQYACGGLILWFIALLLVFIVVFVRARLERSLRMRYAALLNPPGKA